MLLTQNNEGFVSNEVANGGTRSLGAAKPLVHCVKPPFMMVTSHKGQFFQLQGICTKLQVVPVCVREPVL